MKSESDRRTKMKIFVQIEASVWRTGERSAWPNSFRQFSELEFQAACDACIRIGLFMATVVLRLCEVFASHDKLILICTRTHTGSLQPREHTPPRTALAHHWEPCSAHARSLHHADRPIDKDRFLHSPPPPSLLLSGKSSSSVRNPKLFFLRSHPREPAVLM